MITIGNEPGHDPLSKILVDEEEDHDGWGPIRPRRSSTPPDLHRADSCPAAEQPLELSDQLAESGTTPEQTPTRR
jgi:hypothetical protein